MFDIMYLYFMLVLCKKYIDKKIKCTIHISHISIILYLVVGCTGCAAK